LERRSAPHDRRHRRARRARGRQPWVEGGAIRAV